MTTAEARARVEDDARWQADPALTAAEVDRLVERARVADAAGKAPGETGYVPTYTAASVWLSTALGWEWKAGNAIKSDVKADKVESERSQVYYMCEAKAKHFREKAAALAPRVGSLRVSTFGAGA